MSTTLTAEVKGLDSVVLRLESMPGAIRNAIAAVVTEEAIRLETIVKDQKLTGQVLNNRSGRLRSSIHHEVEIGEKAVIGGVFANMDEAAYARYWEYGFTGTEQVRAHLRAISQAFGKPLATPRDVLVKAHTRKVEQPARSYLRSTLEENAERIRGRLEAAARQVASGDAP